MSKYHEPVMLEEVMAYLDVKAGRWYVDCNLGGGGHTERILELGGNVVGIDLDPEAILEVANKHQIICSKRKGKLRAYSEKLILLQENFSRIQEVMKEVGKPRVSGILFDLGISSHQLGSGERGFSFNLDSPLDMRMDKNAQIPTAADLVNGLHERELSELFWKLGEENFARAIAREIVRKRQKQRIETTDQLAQIILKVRKRGKDDRTHPATRVFQALRIAVNDELNSLREALPQSFDLLEDGGRLVVISFHSLEDRIVKDFFAEQAANGRAKILTKKPLQPALAEVEANPRSRSGKLRSLLKQSDAARII